MNLYTLENIYKTYKNNNNENHALNDIDLNIKEGEVVVILGPSGSGKSTLLNILSGIDKPSRGKIFYKKERLDKINDDSLRCYRKDHLGFIFQSYNLIPNLTVKENIELGSKLSDNPLKMKEIMDIMNLTKEKNKYPYQLSGGQMQRVAIARALVKNPEVLFCDEPTGALDEKMGKKVLSLLQQIHEKYNTTIIIVTHNPSIASMANTVIKLSSGKIESIKHNKKIIDASELRWA